VSQASRDVGASSSTPTKTRVEGELTTRMRVPAVERSAAVLEALAASREPLTFGELAARVQYARSSLHDVCSSLVDAGLVEKTREGRYAIGLKIVELARRRLNSMEVVSAFQAVCRADGTSAETIVLSVLSGPDVIYVSFIDGQRPLAVKYEIGMRLPAAFTASGKAILSTLPQQRVRELLPAQLNNPHGIARRKSLRTLLAELELTRNRGYSIDDEETAIGMTCIGAPVFMANSDVAVGAVAISLVKSATDWFDSANSDYIRNMAGRISAQLGAHTTW
jgi:DNA-binding IclR family transcriptional regulator